MAFVGRGFAGSVIEDRISGGRSRDGFHKSGVVRFSDGRLTFIATGLAIAGDFRSSMWIPCALLKAGENAVTTEAAIQRFAGLAEEEFERLAKKHLFGSRQDRALSVAFTGFTRTTTLTGPTRRVFLVSNCQAIHPVEGRIVDLPQTSDEFLVTQGPNAATSVSMVTVGSGIVRLPPYDVVFDMLEKGNVHPRHVVDRLAHLIRKSADGVTVGKTCMSIVLWPGAHEPHAMIHRPDQPTSRIALPAFVNAEYGLRGAFARVEERLEFVDENGQPLPASVPQARKNASCPCGSGRRYRQCHGSKPIVQAEARRSFKQVVALRPSDGSPIGWDAF